MKHTPGMATLKANAQLPFGQGAKARAIRKPTPLVTATLALAIALVGQVGVGAATSAPLNAPQAGANAAPAVARGVGVAPAMPISPTDESIQGSPLLRPVAQLGAQPADHTGRNGRDHG